MDAKGDVEGEWTYTEGSGNSVIDYVLGDEEVRMQVSRVNVRDNVDSDHYPIIVLDGKGGKKKLKRKERTSKKWVWTQEGKEEFRKALGNIKEVLEKVDEVWENMRDKIKEVMIDGCASKGVKRKRGWWDSECKEEKNIVRRELWRWREKGGDGNLYKEAKGKYKKLIEGKKKEERERWEKKLREIRTEEHVWKIVNRERKRR
ncbi:hypothetical protein ACFW04_014677 [Cataglyphis niger]